MPPSLELFMVCQKKALFRFPLLTRIGSPARTRTTDPMVNSHLLYRLSY